MTTPLPPLGSTDWYGWASQVHSHTTATGNPHSTTKADLGLGNVTNTAVVVLTQAAYNALTPAAGTVYVISG